MSNQNSRRHRVVDDEENPKGQHNEVTLMTQTKLLFVKNWLTKRRTEPKKLLGEILLPVFYLIILSFLVRLEKRTTYPEVKESFEKPQNVLNQLVTWDPQTIHVVPDNNYSNEMAKRMESVLGNHSRERGALKFKFYSNVTTLVEAYYVDSTIEMAVVFSDSDEFSYTIRINPDQVNKVPLPSAKKIGRETCRDRNKLEDMLERTSTCPVNGYFYSNFLALQYLVDQALIMKSAGENASEEYRIPIEVENYPKAQFTAGMSTFLRVIIPLYCIIPLAQLINTLLILIVTEKENKIKDGLKMIGVSDVAYWCSWFGIYGIMATVFAAMFTLVMHFMNVLKNINPVILFLLFLFFGLSIITFAFALTPFFHKPKTAGAVGTLVMQFTGMLFMLQTFIFDSGSAVLMPLRLISSVAFTTAIDDACAYEFEGGILLADILPGRKGAGIFYSLIFLIFDTLLYGLLAIYLDNIIPNEYGIRKHPLFCFNPFFWFGSKNSELETDSIAGVDGIVEVDNDDVEKVHSSMIGKEAIRIRNLSKTYGSWPSTKIVEAVKGVTLDIYEGQITAILGRNGAGKSTLVNMMTGLIAPSNGRCIVFGFDISDPYDMARLRRMTGVCMQQDLHFNALTAQEHLEFYGKLRGIQKDELAIEINELLQELQLIDQRNVAAVKLSGGQKRKLSVGIALIGSPKIILLDEPSAGVDPVSRRHLWSLLQKKKEGRVILLTTHFMDEADVLADRKAIIHDGNMKCVGSSLFLKNRFGVGYYLTIEMDERNLNMKACDDVINKWIPASLPSRKIIATEVKYALPHAEVHHFAGLFADIEELIESPSSNIKSYGVSMTTLEEVFLKISNDMGVTANNHENDIMPHRRMSDLSYRSGNGITDEPLTNLCEQVESMDEQNLIPNIGETTPNSRSILWAICILRIRRLVRNPQSLFFMVFMPVILVAVGFGLVKTQNVAIQEIKLSFATTSKGSDIYPSKELNLAVSSDSINETQLQQFLQTNGFNAVKYSGIYADLLNTNNDIGTMASLSIRKLDNNLTSEVRINGTYLHVPAMVVNILSQYSLSLASNTSKKITTISQPFPSKTSRVFDQTTFYAVFLIAPAFTFAAIGMVMEIVHDREIKARNHLRVNGLSLEMYFSSIFIVFGFLSLMVTVMLIVIVYAFSVAAFMNPYAMTVVVTLLVIFIFPCLLFSAIFSYLFDRMESAQTVFSQVCSWMGSIFGITLILVDAFATNRSIPLILHSVFSALDIFYIPFGIFYYTNKQYITCTIFDTCDELSFKDYLGTEFLVMGIAMLIQIPVFLLILIVADVIKDGGKSFNALQTLMFKRGTSGTRVANSPDSNLQNMSEDEDVRNEKMRVLDYFQDEQQNEKCVVGLKNLRKSYTCKKTKDSSGKSISRKEVLHGIDFLVEEGEVFGLLGHNGAGKTTTMQIIIAEEASDSGKVRLCGHDINSNLSAAFSKLGYCPQHDALWDNISMREHMELYAIIRGVQPHMRSKLIRHFLKGLQITEHSEKRTKELSGGTKRKLSYCMSMLGAPKIVLLDEPSSGMDIMSKRFLWNTVLGTFKDSRGAILTTHSMEEADALCTKIAIMVKGTLLCIGSPQHLKSKYGAGYTLEIKLKTEEIQLDSSLNSLLEGVIVESSPNHAEKFAFVQQHFPDITLSELFGNRAVFSVPTSAIRSISQTFALLEQLKRTHDVEEYSFSQTTLEQVFLQFAKEEDLPH